MGDTRGRSKWLNEYWRALKIPLIWIKRVFSCSCFRVKTRFFSLLIWIFCQTYRAWLFPTLYVPIWKQHCSSQKSIHQGSGRMHMHEDQLHICVTCAHFSRRLFLTSSFCKSDCVLVGLLEASKKQPPAELTYDLLRPDWVSGDPQSLCALLCSFQKNLN